MLKKNKHLIVILLAFLTFVRIGANGQTQSTAAKQQQGTERIITGTVLDELGAPIAGATAIVDGSTRGSITEVDGTFTLKVKSSDVLVISFLGYENVVVPVGNNSTITVTLKPKANELDEVMVVAFAKQKKESVLASISTIAPSQLKAPTSNLTTTLAGRVAGLVSYQRSGEPGADDANFFIRGVTSLTYASGPLILIDGVEMTSSDLARLQADDIASFSIMKDATATALYGARGANGVILVTTKEGREGPASITIRYETSVSEPTQNVKIADPITYMRLNNEAVTTRDRMAVAPYSLEKIDNTVSGVNPYVYPANDWQALLLQNKAINHRLNFNLNGGGKVARYYVAGTYNQDNGIIKVDKRNNFNNNIDLKRYLLRSNVNINVTKTTEIVVRLHGTFDDYTGPIDGGSQVYQKIMRTDPVLFAPYYEPDEASVGTRHIMFGNYDKGQYLNPYADIVKGYKQYSKTTMLAQFELKQDLAFITEGLKAKGTFNTTRYSYFDVVRNYKPFYYSISDYDRIADKYTLLALNPTTGTEYIDLANGNKDVNTVTYLEASLSYDRTFGKHGVSGLLVGTARNKLIAIIPSDYQANLSKSLPYRNLGLAGRFTYNYDSRYFAEFNFGYNGSERFAPNERFGFFPSAGVGYIVSNEAFYGEGLKRAVNMLKLKATYGVVGNDAIGDTGDRFFYLSNVNMNNGSYGYTFGNEYMYSIPNGISVSRYPNDGITWERSYKTNFGIEARLFDMADLQIDYYTEKRTGILLDRLFIPANIGLGSVKPQANVGEAKGSGVDAMLDVSKHISNDFWISARANFTFARAKYTKYEDIDQTNTPWLSKIGTAVSQQWGYIAERLFVDEADVANSPQQFGNYMAGDIKYRDINDDGVITSVDKVPIGYPREPEIIYGFGISTGYKGIDFSCFFQGSARSSFWIDANATAPFIDNDGNSSVISKNALLQVYADNHWSELNRDLYALWPRLDNESNTNNQQISTWFMRDGSFMRLKSVELGYTLPEKLLRKIQMKNLRIYASGTNLLTFSKFDLWDPEMASNGLQYPIQRVINLGIQLSF